MSEPLTIPEKELRGRVRDAAEALARACVAENAAVRDVLFCRNQFEAALFEVYPRGGGPR